MIQHLGWKRVQSWFQSITECDISHQRILLKFSKLRKILSFFIEAIFVLHVNLIGNLVVTFLNKMSEQNFFKGSARFFLRSSARPWIIDQEVSNHQTFLNKPLICWQVYQIFFFWSRNKQSQIFFLSWHSTTIDIF